MAQACYGVVALALVLVFCCINGDAKTLVTSVGIESGPSIANTDEDFICATLDWWPPQKCDYGVCSWGQSSLLNVDLKNPLFSKAIKAFSPLKLRLGGSLQDQIIYDVGKSKESCKPFVQDNSTMFGFRGGCLSMERWDSLNALFKETGANIVFGLNALTGRHNISSSEMGGPWDSSNSEDFIRYTAEKGYKIAGWELGNELCGAGVSTKISAKQYAADVIKLDKILKEIYDNTKERPLLIAPSGFFDADWFKEFLQMSGSNIVNAVTHHIYNLGAGVDKNLVEKILDPGFLDREVATFKSLEEIVRTYSPSSRPWVGEAGGAYNSGHDHVSNAFVYGFWFLDQLGMSATYNTASYCRQAFIGGNYGLLNTTTYAPNPDYYNALLWHRLMGTNVLKTTHKGSQYLRTYAHCSKNTKGVTVLLMNYSNNTRMFVKVATPNSTTEANIEERNIIATVTPIKQETLFRLEYHLTAKDGDLHSQTVLLNEVPLDITSDGELPSLKPIKVDATRRVSLGPHSIAFVQVPYFQHPACSK